MSENTTTRRWPVLAWLILSQLLYAGLLFPWLFASMMAIMAFDAGVNLYNLTFVGVLWSYPLWPVLFSILAWISFARRKDKWAVILTTVPSVIVALAVSVFLLLVELGF
jgi:uncharacterized membrane protein